MRLIPVTLSLAASVALAAVAPAPTPVLLTAQARAAVPKTPFDTAPVVVVAEVLERRIVQDVDGDKGWYDPPRVHTEYLLWCWAVRVNKRAAHDPDLTKGFDLILRPIPGAPVRLAFGREYVLFVKLDRDVWRPGLPPPPRYVFALPDAGFEVGEDTVRVLRAGKSLAPYDGHPSAEVLRLVDPRYADHVGPPIHWKR